MTVKPSKPRRKARDKAIANSVERWFASNMRDLPWRTDPRDGYYALVSEAMLLQTQASRIAERFPVFIELFPTIHDLASASEEDVLAQWSGLGYYRRAKNLHRAALQVVEQHDGVVPSDIDLLRALPGVGRYTAGSIASIAYNEPAPIVDGNVVRVLLRVEGRDLPPTETATMNLLWTLATGLVEAADSPALFNEGLMELGATVCTPKSPGCNTCPVKTRCVARREKTQHEIPRPKPRAKQTAVHAASVVVRDSKGRLLIERRGDSGMWAGMWQAPTIEREGKSPTRAAIEAIAPGGKPKKVAAFEHLTTHRRFEFTVYEAPAPPRRGSNQRWATRAQIAELALARPQMRILLGDSGAGLNAGRRKSEG